jgi:prevent-host-death family protein
MKTKKISKPLNYLRTNTNEALRTVSTRHQILVLTQNGEAKAVLQSLASYERTQTSLALLKILLLGATSATDSGSQPLKHALRSLRLRIREERTWLCVVDVANASGRSVREMSRQLKRWQRAGKIFAVPALGAEQELRYPAYQFDGNMKPVPAIATVLKVFAGKKRDPWKIAAWFISASGWLRGRAPKDCLSQPQRVIEAAKHEVEGIYG